MYDEQTPRRPFTERTRVGVSIAGFISIISVLVVGGIWLGRYMQAIDTAIKNAVTRDDVTSAIRNIVPSIVQEAVRVELVAKCPARLSLRVPFDCPVQARAR